MLLVGNYSIYGFYTFVAFMENLYWLFNLNFSFFIFFFCLIIRELNSVISTTLITWHRGAGKCVFEGPISC